MPRMPQQTVDAPCKPGERIDVVVRHATNGTEMTVSLPAQARFKHIKTALARRLESDEILTRGQLINNSSGIYSAYKDGHRIGDVREVLALCVDLIPPDDGPMSAELAEQDLTDEEAERASSMSKASASTSSGFNKDRAVSLQRDLLAGFEAEDFQLKLQALETRRESLPSQAHFAKERQALLLTVQAAVLPGYGFEGTQAGVYKMMGAMGPFIHDPEFVQLANAINRAIGIDSPQDTWAALAKSCRKVEEEPRERQHQKALNARPRGLPGLLGGLGGLGGGFTSFAAPVPLNTGEAPKGLSPPKPADTKDAAPARPRVLETASSKPPDPPPRQPTSGSTSKAPPQEEEEAPLFEPWPADKTPPFKLFAAGSWNDYKPVQMQWQEGMFICPVKVGSEGLATFQLLLNGSWDRTFYPSVADASTLDEHTVSGPDDKGHGVNWLIGKYVEEEAKPHARFVIVAGVDKSGIVRLVSWQPVG